MSESYSEWVIIELRKYESAEVINGIVIRPSTSIMNKLGNNNGLVHKHYHPNNFIIPANKPENYTIKKIRKGYYSRTIVDDWRGTNLLMN